MSRRKTSPAAKAFVLLACCIVIVGAGLVLNVVLLTRMNYIVDRLEEDHGAILCHQGASDRCR